MSGKNNTERLHKELKLFDIFALATGTTLSAGFFLLPGLAAIEAGPALIFAYLIAAIPLIPATFSVVELTTAMPRAGGVYYFLDRALGPVMGTIGGIGTWCALNLKVAFALIGMGSYIALFLPQLPIIPVAILIALILGIINLMGARSSGSFQIVLVVCLLGILVLFIAGGMDRVQPVNFTGLFDVSSNSLLSTAAMVYISYVGVTKVASLSEEVKNPERNLPRGIFLALGTAIVIYALGTTVMVGIIPMEKLAGDLTPVATAADYIFGKYGVILVSFGALLAFTSVANAGTMSASRYPLAMSRDEMMPTFFQKLSGRGMPYYSIISMVGTIVLFLVFLDTTKIVKLASAFQLLMFMLVCLAVIIMRESKIESYDPGYKSPLYPWMQIIGVVTSLWLLFQMGFIPKLLTFVMVLVCIVWYKYYVKHKVFRSGAIFHIFEKLGRSRYAGLDRELRGILKEKGLRKDDPFDELVARSFVIDLENRMSFVELVDKASNYLSNFTKLSSFDLKTRFLEGTRIGATPVTHEVALPHLRVEGLGRMELVIARSRDGIEIEFNSPLNDFKEDKQIVKALFFLLSPEDNPTQHLRILAQIAGVVDDPNFIELWKSCKDEQELKEMLIHDERFLSVLLEEDSPYVTMVGCKLKDLNLPEDSLVALIKRDDDIIVPRGNTVLKSNDRITIIGEPIAIKEFQIRYKTE